MKAKITSTSPCHSDFIELTLMNGKKISIRKDAIIRIDEGEYYGKKMNSK